ncbi:CPBP family intramembrane glutamic endopeptidase [Cesiribacter andamanensis]|nr:CPBP family intramembrane glutamic endopeptidase [Cesiribacter andamanensis]
MLPAIFLFFAKQLSPGMLTVELYFWGTALVVLLFVKKGEQLGFSSIGLPPFKYTYLVWGVGLGTVLLILFPILNLGVVKLGLEVSSDKAAVLAEMPVYMLFFLALRAGVTEEILYRAYPIERLLTLTGSRWIAALLPLTVFILAHMGWGLGHLVFVTIAGALLTAMYMWKRNLWINMIGHFLVDFITFMLIPLLLQQQ